MSLPQQVSDFLNDNAVATGTSAPNTDTDLFANGVLDSFALVDFVTVIEEHCGVFVPDSDVIPANFRTIEAIESYVTKRTKASAA